MYLLIFKCARNGTTRCPETQNNLKDLKLGLIHFKYIYFSVLSLQTAETSNRFLISILIFQNQIQHMLPNEICKNIKEGNKILKLL